MPVAANAFHWQPVGSSIEATVGAGPVRHPGAASTKGWLFYPPGKQRGQHLPQGVGYLAGGRVGRIRSSSPKNPSFEAVLVPPKGGHRRPCGRPGALRSEVAWDLSLWSSPKFSFNPNSFYPRRSLSLLLAPKPLGAPPPQSERRGVVD